MDEHGPVSESAKLELEQMMRKTTGYPLLSIARTLLKLMAVLVILGGVGELFLFSLKPDSSRVLSDSLSSFAIASHLVGIAAQAFGLLVMAECLRLGLDLSFELRSLKNR